MDLVKTIEDDQEIDYQSDSSRDENEDDDLKKPIKQKKIKKNTDFDESFAFVSNQKDYLKDTWSDLSAYIRKKANSKLTDKIAKVRQQRLEENNEEENNESDEDLDSEEEDNEEWDDVKTKKEMQKIEDGSEKSMVKIQEEFFDYDDSATFQSMNLSRPLLKAIDSLNWGHPTPIQAATIPTALAGKDICGCAATGTGKTAAYMLPILERLIFRSAADSVTRVLVLVPTRELGVQVFQVNMNFHFLSWILKIPIVGVCRAILNF